MTDTGWCRSHVQALFIATSLRALFARRKQSVSPSSRFCAAPFWTRSNAQIPTMRVNLRHRRSHTPTSLIPQAKRIIGLCDVQFVPISLDTI
jgi:hypothetical protein